MEFDDQRVVRRDRLDQAVAAGLVVALDRERAEEPVEDDQHAAVIGIEVVEIGGMMNAAPEPMGAAATVARFS